MSSKWLADYYQQMTAPLCLREEGLVVSCRFAPDTIDGGMSLLSMKNSSWTFVVSVVVAVGSLVTIAGSPLFGADSSVPPWVSVYPGAKIQVDSRYPNSKSEMQFVLTTPDACKQVVGFYEKRLTLAGLTIRHAAGNDQVAGVLINRQTMRTFLSTRRLPLRDSFVCFQINGGREVLVLVIHVEAAALCVDCITLGPAFKCQFFFLTQSLAVQNTDSVVFRCSNPDFFCWRYIDDAVGGRIDVATGFTREGPFINGAYTGVGPVTDVHYAIANRYAAGPLIAFATLDFHFLCRKARDLTDAVVAGVHHID